MTLPSKSNQPSLRPSKDEGPFAEIVQLIAAAREQAVRDVNTILIDLYWKVGDHQPQDRSRGVGRRHSGKARTVHRQDPAWYPWFQSAEPVPNEAVLRDL